MGAVRSRLRTIGDLRRSGALLEFTCCHCGTRRLFDPSALPFGPAQLVVTAHRRMNCSACGWEGHGSFTRARPMLPAGTIADPGGVRDVLGWPEQAAK